MATIIIPTIPNLPYWYSADFIKANPERWFVLETNDGVFEATAADALAVFEDLAPGEAFTVLAVCDTEIEATRFATADRS
jgi:hypothetical protein